MVVLSRLGLGAGEGVVTGVVVTTLSRISGTLFPSSGDRNGELLGLKVLNPSGPHISS
jgi:hypothetical protein